MASVVVSDLLGSGSACLAWSEFNPYGHEVLRYMPLVQGCKPNMMTGFNNGLGAQCTYTYKPSTHFSRQDARAGQPWTTKLPKPIQCIERAVMRDRITNHKSTTSYAYHNGYWDGEEGEFAGFGRVDVWNADSWDSSSMITETRATVHSRKYHHLGVKQSQKSHSRLKPSAIPSELSTKERADAYRALRGEVLREEVFDSNGSLMTIEESNYSVVLRQHAQREAPAAFRIDVREKWSEMCGAEVQGDSRIEREFVVDVNDYGDVLCSVHVALGRGSSSSLRPSDQKRQQETIVMVTQALYTNSIDENNVCRSPLLAQASEYRVWGYEQSLKWEGMRTLAKSLGDFETAPLSTVASPHRGKALARSEQVRFRSQDLSQELPLGVLEPFSIEHRRYECVAESEDLPGLSTCHEAAPEQLKIKPTDLGYVNFLLDGHYRWWRQSPRSTFSVTLTAELEEARRRFFKPRFTIDALGNTSSEELDQFALMTAVTVDPVGNEQQMEYDYARMQVVATLDENMNRVASAFDGMQNVVATAHEGKETALSGDSISNVVTSLSISELDSFYKDPVREAPGLLAGASSRKIIDLTRYERLAQPNFEAEIRRNRHINSSYGSDELSISFTYMDGQGRPLIVAEFADQKWWFSGLGVLDHQNRIVEQQRPYCQDSHILTPHQGVREVYFFDGLGRQVGTLFPDHTWTKTIFTPWSTTEYDTGDTVLIAEPAADSDIGEFFRHLPKAAYFPTWYQERQQLTDGDERAAAAKSAAYHNAPTVKHVDARELVIVTVKGSGSQRQTEKTFYDYLGRAYAHVDGLGRMAQKMDQDLLNRTTSLQGMEAAAVTTIYNNNNLPALIKRGDELTHLRYDALGRSISKDIFTLHEGLKMIQKMEYGEIEPDPLSNNLRGRIVRIWDQAGLHRRLDYDLHGNCTRQSLEAAVEYKRTIDWHTNNDLERPSTTTCFFDAQSRNISVCDVSGATTQKQYDPRGLQIQVECRLETERDSKVLMRDAKYNPEGRLISAKFSEATATYEYDPKTSLLKHRHVIKSSSRDPDSRDLENKTFHHDCRMNVTCEEDTAIKTVFYRGEMIKPRREFTYDIFGRLVAATGREQINGRAGIARSLNPLNPSPRKSSALSNSQELCNYTELYEYDQAGNMRYMRHRPTTNKSVMGWSRHFSYREPSTLQPDRFSNKLSKTTVGRTVDTYAYDTSTGVAITMPGHSQLTWDHNDQLRSSASQKVTDGIPETTWYVYDSTGTRVRKVTERSNGKRRRDTRYFSGLEVLRTYAGDGNRCTLDQATTNIEAPGVDVSIEQTTGGTTLTRFRLENTLEVDEEAKLISYEEYTPFGSISYTAYPGEITAPRRYRFARYRRDTETGLYYTRARYYAPWLCRWMSPDPIGIGDGLNLFAYCGNDPINLTDPDGTAPGGKEEEEERKEEGGGGDKMGISSRVAGFYQRIVRVLLGTSEGQANPTVNPNPSTTHGNVHGTVKAKGVYNRGSLPGDGNPSMGEREGNVRFGTLVNLKVALANPVASSPNKINIDTGADNATNGDAGIANTAKGDVGTSDSSGRGLTYSFKAFLAELFSGNASSSESQELPPPPDEGPCIQDVREGNTPKFPNMWS